MSMKIPLTTYVEPEIDAALSKATAVKGESRSQYLRRLVFHDLEERGLVTAEALRELAVEGNRHRSR